MISQFLGLDLSRNRTADSLETGPHFPLTNHYKHPNLSFMSHTHHKLVPQQQCWPFVRGIHRCVITINSDICTDISAGPLWGESTGVWSPWTLPHAQIAVLTGDASKFVVIWWLYLKLQQNIFCRQFCETGSCSWLQSVYWAYQATHTLWPSHRWQIIDNSNFWHCDISFNTWHAIKSLMGTTQRSFRYTTCPSE